MAVTTNSSHTKVSRRTFLRRVGLACAWVGVGGILAACDSQESTIGPAGTSTVGASQTRGNIGGPTGTLSAAATTTRAGGTTNSATIATQAVPVATVDPATVVDPRQVATLFLRAWHDKRYADMYALLTGNAKAAIAQDAFVTRYQNITTEATITDIKAEVEAAALNAKPPASSQDNLQVPFGITFTTSRVGQLTQSNYLLLKRQNGGNWGIEWSPAAIFKELGPDDLIHLFGDDPVRGNVYDRNGKELAVNDKAYSVFVVPGKITDEAALLDVLSQVLNLDKDKIKTKYTGGNPVWQMPIKDIPYDTPQDVQDRLLAVKGIGLNEKISRSYPQKESGANVIGYVGAITADDLKIYGPKGYREDDQIGRAGVERAEEINSLGGVKGGRLTVLGRDGTLIKILQETPAQPGSNLYLTMEVNLQKTCEQLLGQRLGSITVMDPNDGSILALASFPNYDPNVFIQGISQQQYDALANDPRNPFQDRPVEGSYPTGSIFKVISASGALEKLGMTMETVYTCPGHWIGLGPQNAKDCWLKTGHGRISLYQGIVQSCDSVFYEIGKKMYETDPSMLPTITEAFGLGVSTSVQGLFDSAGQVPDKDWKQKVLKQVIFPGDDVNLAIGQGYLLATPLQMANVYAGIATGGVQPIPNLILRKDTNGTQTQAVGQKLRQLPVSDVHLAQIRKALTDVTTSGNGTATSSFYGSKVKVAGKTGTAESGKPEPHAWFACFAPAEKAKYVIIVMLEQGGEGNVVAAPLARKVIDVLNF